MLIDWRTQQLLGNTEFCFQIGISNYCSLEKIWREKIFVGHQVRRKLNTKKFSYHKEIEYHKTGNFGEWKHWRIWRIMVKSPNLNLPT